MSNQPTNFFTKILPVITYLVFTGLIIYTSLFHEKWIDEAQPWLIARDLDFWSMLKHLRYEITPGLWHFILYPFAHAGFSYFTQTILNLIIILLAAYILLFRSPFSLPVKILFIFSYYFSFEYAVIARSYGLTIAILFLLLSIYSRRLSQTIIFSILLILLAQTNAIGLVIAGALWLISWFDYYLLIKTKKNTKVFLISAFFVLFGLFLSLIQFWPTADPAHQSIKIFSSIELPSLINSFVAGFFPYSLLNIDNFNSYRNFVYIFNYYNLFLALAILAIITWRFFSSRKIIIFLISCFVPLLFLLSAHRVGHLRHYGFFLIIVIAAYWIDLKSSSCKIITLKEKIFTSFLIISLFLLDLIGFRAHYLDQKYLFSDAINVANYLQQNNLTEQPIFVTDSFYSVSILPYLKNHSQFYYLRPEKLGSFFFLDKNFYLTKSKNINQILENFSRPNTDQKLILITTESISIKNQKNWQQLYQTTGYLIGYDDQLFYIYQSR